MFVFPHELGAISVTFSPRGLCRLELGGSQEDGGQASRASQTERLARRLRHALERYFSGRREGFDSIPLDFEGATPFQEAVWRAARSVVWGELSNYGRLAELSGWPRGAARAVGQALGANPIPVIVPCHRFLRADGGLGGFSAGLAWKRELLRLEGHDVGL